MTPGPGTILLLDGINAVSLIRSRYRQGLRAAGLGHHIEPFAWSRGPLYAPSFYDLWHRGHHRRSADRLAAVIRQLRSDRPAEPLHLIGHSGGAAIIAFALERLTAAETVSSVVFLNPGLSPGYDLTPVLDRTTGLLAVSSYLDFFMLGWGTTLLGTMDRRHSPSAGFLGFRCKDLKLTAWHWRISDIPRIGWWGWHLSAANAGLIQAVANWIRDRNVA